MTAEQWKQIILNFNCKNNYENPFLDVSIMAEFIGPSGKIIRREAYWDGGSEYKVAFAPTEIGIWNWTVKADENTGLNGLSGTIKCIEYQGNLDIYRHGFLKVSSSGKYLTYNDGTPFFWLGDTHWEFAYKERWNESNHPQMDSMFKGMAKKRVEQGYNVYQTNLRSDEIMGGDALYWTKNSKKDLPNIEFYKNELDRRMYYLADIGLVNALGLAWFMSISNNIDHIKNLARYIVARYGALPIIWTLAGEVAGYSGGDLRQKYIDEWREIAKYIEQIDDYGHLQTAHYTNERPFADYYQDEKWFDFTLNQAGHGDYPISPSHYKEFIKKHPDKPFIEGEAFYEFCSTLEENGTRICTADMLRRVAYMSIQLGGCGYTYGAQGIWDCIWEKGQPNPMKIFNRFDVTWYEAIDGVGGLQMGYMKSFYEKARFWEMEPYAENEKNLSWNKAPLITINKNANRFIVYYFDTTTKNHLIKKVNPGEYSAQWFNPRTGEYISIPQKISAINGELELPLKPDDGDWLLTIEQI